MSKGSKFYVVQSSLCNMKDCSKWQILCHCQVVFKFEDNGSICMRTRFVPLKTPLRIGSYSTLACV